MRKLILFLMLIFPFTINATHIRGGEITYQWFGGHTYKFLVAVYDNNFSGIDTLLELTYGDGELDTLPLISILVNSGVYKCTYESIHTFPGPGFYSLACELPTWSTNILNVINSVNVSFQNTTTLNIDPFISIGNNSVVYQSNHWDVSINSGSIIHDPMTLDPDGDSLVYSLIPCGGMSLGSVYNFPNVVAGGTVQLDQFGTFQYNNLSSSGLYAVNLRVEEWKYGILRGVSNRQMLFDWIVSDIDEIDPDETVFYSQSDNEITINSEEILESVKVFDVTGKLLFSSVNINTNSLVIPASKGLFIVETKTTKNHISTRKFVGR